VKRCQVEAKRCVDPKTDNRRVSCPSVISKRDMPTSYKIKYITLDSNKTLNPKTLKP
jgi:hypothetical protein